jgi:hypothetical protein
MTTMQERSLTPAAQRLDHRLRSVSVAGAPEGSTIHVAGIGRGFYRAYEQLRNAADYRERHLLLRGAIERYLYRNVSLKREQPVATDLITDLTQAGYLQNDSVARATAHHIDTLLARYTQLLVAAPATTPHDTMRRWVFQVASGQIEAWLDPRPRLAIAMTFAYEHYWASVDRANLGAADEPDQVYQVSLHCAVQRAVFKSDLATTRYTWMASQLKGLDHDSFEGFLALNQLIDDAYISPLTNRLSRLINRYGAPMRVLAEMVSSGSELHLADHKDTDSHIRRTCTHLYGTMHQRLNSRIGKVLLFIFLTKVLIGIGIEVPYDLAVHSAIAWWPLTINILFPVVYMALLSLHIAEPDRHNTEVINSYLDRMLYHDGQEPIRYKLKKRVTSPSLRRAFNVVYGLAFAVSFGLLVWALVKLGYNVVNGAIFFVFLSAVSFLGLRIRQMARELSMLDMRQSLLQTVADFLSTPFIRVGYWLSDRYARLNLVAALLDTAIELPLKSTLRLIQHWTGFLRDKQEEL